MPLSNKLDCGKMRHRIQIVAPNGTQDSFGGIQAGSSYDWQVQLICWASIEAMSARDAAAAGTFVLPSATRSRSAIHVTCLR